VNIISTYIRSSILVSTLITLAGCGGGGGGISGGGDTGWQQGVFLDSDSFIAECAAPRAGTNPATGRAYPDVAGTLLDENNFLRSFSNEIYLWYSEIVDRDPGLYNDTLTYFDLLRTTATTPSGADKDKFHFTYDTEEYFQLSQGGVSVGYGAQWAVLEASPPNRDIRIAYMEPNSPARPATIANVARGTRILEIDGANVADGDADVLNAGLSPSEDDPTHTFTVQDLGAASSRVITMTAEEVTNAMVQNVNVLVMPDTTRVGYMTFHRHRAPAEEALVDAINQLNAGPGIDDLVLDIRYNGGGFLDIASELAYMIAGPARTGGRTFELLQFNDKHPVTDPITGVAITPVPFHNTAQGFTVPNGQALPTLNLSRVFVLTGSGTCSASEAVMNGLRGVDVEVIQIGSTTCGKPYGFYPVDNCGTTYFTVQFRGVNEKNFGDYTDGFSPANTAANLGTVVPGCSVADDFSKPLGDVTEERLAAALAYRDGQACPAASGFGPTPGLSKTTASQRPADGVIYQSPWDSNRIMRRQQP